MNKNDRGMENHVIKHVWLMLILRVIVVNVLNLKEMKSKLFYEFVPQIIKNNKSAFFIKKNNKNLFCGFKVCQIYLWINFRHHPSLILKNKLDTNTAHTISKVESKPVLPVVRSFLIQIAWLWLLFWYSNIPFSNNTIYSIFEQDG